MVTGCSKNGRRVIEQTAPSHDGWSFGRRWLNWEDAPELRAETPTDIYVVICSLMIKDCHERVAHLGQEWVLSSLKYWIVKGRASVPVVN